MNEFHWELLQTIEAAKNQTSVCSFVQIYPLSWCQISWSINFYMIGFFKQMSANFFKRRCIYTSLVKYRMLVDPIGAPLTTWWFLGCPKNWIGSPRMRPTLQPRSLHAFEALGERSLSDFSQRSNGRPGGSMEDVVWCSMLLLLMEENPEGYLGCLTRYCIAPSCDKVYTMYIYIH